MSFYLSLEDIQYLNDWKIQSNFPPLKRDSPIGFSSGQYFHVIWDDEYGDPFPYSYILLMVRTLILLDLPFNCSKEKEEYYMSVWNAVKEETSWEGFKRIPLSKEDRIRLEFEYSFP